MTEQTKRESDQGNASLRHRVPKRKSDDSNATNEDEENQRQERLSWGKILSNTMRNSSDSLNEYLCSPRTMTVSKRKRKKIRRASNDRKKKKQSCCGALKTTCRCTKMIIFALFLTVLGVYRNEIISLVNQRKLFTCGTFWRRALRGMDCFNLFKDYHYSVQELQRQKLDIFNHDFIEYFDQNEENWAYWYFFDDAMAKKQIEMESLPEKLKTDPSEFLEFVKAFHRVAVKETLSDDDYSEVDKFMRDGGFANVLPAKELSTHLQSSKSEDALVEALQCNIYANYISEHWKSLRGAKLFDLAVKYHLFFTKCPNSLLFGPRDDPQTLINFKPFYDVCDDDAWDDLYSFVNAMVTNKIPMESLPENPKDKPFEFFKFITTFHHISIHIPSLHGQKLFDFTVKYHEWFSDIQKFTQYFDEHGGWGNLYLFDSAMVSNNIPMESLPENLKTDPSEFLKFIFTFLRIPIHIPSLHGQELFDFTVKYHAFFSEFSSSLLFGDRDDPQSFINFKTFLDAEIFVIDLDETMYSIQRDGWTPIQDEGHKQDTFHDKFGSGKMVWNPEFQYLFESGLFKGKEVYFDTAAMQDFVEPDIKSKIVKLCQKGEAKFKGITYKSDLFREHHWPKFLRKYLKSTEIKKILVIDNKPFEFRGDFDTRKASKEYPEGHRDLPKMNRAHEVESPCLVDAKDNAGFINAHLLGIRSFYVYENRGEGKPHMTFLRSWTKVDGNYFAPGHKGWQSPAKQAGWWGT